MGIDLITKFVSRKLAIVAIALFCLFKIPDNNVWQLSAIKILSIAAIAIVYLFVLKDCAPEILEKNGTEEKK